MCSSECIRLGTNFCQLHDSNNTDVILDESAGLINLDIQTRHMYVQSVLNIVHVDM